MTEVYIRLFASLKDLAGSNRITVDLPDDASVDALKKAIATQHPALAAAVDSSIIAINQEYVSHEHPVTAEDEIAIFPPVSGGSIDWPEVFLVADHPIDLNDLTAQIVRPETGAVALFSGYVRGVTTVEDAQMQTAQLHYEAYTPMAVAKMRQVAEEIRQQWPPVQGIAIVQRVGQLMVGEPTVLIACAAGHRDQGCFEAARYGIDRLKEIVPVWKKEIRPDSEAWVEGHYHPTEADAQQGSSPE